MPLQPSRRDTIGPPPRDVSDLAAVVRHQTSYLRSIDPGIQEGRWATPKPVPKGPPRQLVGGDAAGDDTDYAWEWDDRRTVVTVGTQTIRLSHVPIDESLHVFWHPGGRGGKRLTNELFTVDDQTVTIPDPGILAVGDQFSFQYQYEIEDEVLEFAFVAGIQGVFHGDNTMTFTPTADVQPGDFLIAAIRGGVAPGGGDITQGVTSGDARLSSLLFAATLPVVEDVFTGFATGSTADLVVNVIPIGGFSPGARGILGVFRGVNAVTGTSVVQGGTVGSTAPTPQVAGNAAISVTWDGNGSFSLVDAADPTGYTNAGDTGLDYSATSIGYWLDPDGTTSPAGTFAGEGCLVIGVT